MSIPYYDVQVNYDSRSGLIEIYVFHGGWHKVMAKNGLKIRVSDRAEAKRIVEDLLRGLRIVERNL